MKQLKIESGLLLDFHRTLGSALTWQLHLVMDAHIRDYMLDDTINLKGPIIDDLVTSDFKKEAYPTHT